jgi:hypothetical protein
MREGELLGEGLSLDERDLGVDPALIGHGSSEIGDQRISVDCRGKRNGGKIRQRSASAA